MSFNRLQYDDCSYAQKMQRSVNPGDYRLFIDYGENTNKCLPLNAPINSNASVSSVRCVDGNNFSELVNAESHLTNRYITASSCNNKAVDMDHKKLELQHKPVCDDNVATLDSRFTHPIHSYRSMSLMDYHLTPYLHLNPQEHKELLYDRESFGTRSWVKDNYKAPTVPRLDT